jgi:hypothetical protein
LRTANELFRLGGCDGAVPDRISQIGKRDITADTALPLTLLDTSQDFWMNLQKTYELDLARKEHRREVERIEPHANEAVVCSSGVATSPRFGLMGIAQATEADLKAGPPPRRPFASNTAFLLPERALKARAVRSMVRFGVSDKRWQWRSQDNTHWVCGRYDIMSEADLDDAPKKT